MNILKLISTKVIISTLTKPMKIINVLKNILIISSVLLLITSIVVFVIPYLDNIAGYMSLSASVLLMTIQLIFKHFLILDNPLASKTEKKVLKKIAKFELKQAKKTNKKIEKKINNKI